MCPDEIFSYRISIRRTPYAVRILYYAKQFRRSSRPIRLRDPPPREYVASGCEIETIITRVVRIRSSRVIAASVSVVRAVFPFTGFRGTTTCAQDSPWGPLQRPRGPRHCSIRTDVVSEPKVEVCLCLYFWRRILIVPYGHDQIEIRGIKICSEEELNK